MITVWLLVPEPWYELGRWDSVSPVWKLAALTAATVLGFLVGASAAERVGWLQRLFASRNLMHEEVTQRAYQFFYDQRVHRTAGAGGVLIYISLHERMASIIADQAVLDKLGKAAIADLCRELTNDLKRGSLAAAVCGAIDRLGQRLAPALPRAAGDINELPDALITVD
jgi:putative membrane protein